MMSFGDFHTMSRFAVLYRSKGREFKLLCLQICNNLTPLQALHHIKMISSNIYAQIVHAILTYFHVSSDHSIPNLNAIEKAKSKKHVSI